MTQEQISMLLDLFAQIYNATEPEGVSDEEIDGWWQTLAAKLDAVNALIAKQENKERLLQTAENARRVMRDIVDWMNKVSRALERNPNVSELLQIIRKGLDEGRQGMLRQLKEELKQIIVEELGGV